MKKILTLIVMASAMLMFTSCDKEDEPEQITVTLGAQSNTSIGAFYSVAGNKVYKQSEAFANQGKIDIFCFWEEGNDITLASPGSKIKEIFVGEDSPDNWEVKNLTEFIVTEFTVAQYDNAGKDSELLTVSFEEGTPRKKASKLVAGDIVAFRTDDLYIGLIRILETAQGANGSVKFGIKHVKLEHSK